MALKKIVVADTAGFCFGVKRSVEIAEKAMAEFGKCASFGPLIHNEDVISRLREKGLRILSEVKDIREGERVIIRAHGVPPRCILGIG